MPRQTAAAPVGSGTDGEVSARVVVALAEAPSPTATFEAVVVFLGRTYLTRIAPVANPAQKTAAPNTPRRATLAGASAAVLTTRRPRTMVLVVVVRARSFCLVLEKEGEPRGLHGDDDE